MSETVSAVRQCFVCRRQADGAEEWVGTGGAEEAMDERWDWRHCAIAATIVDMSIIAHMFSLCHPSVYEPVCAILCLPLLCDCTPTSIATSHTSEFPFCIVAAMSLYSYNIQHS